MDGSLQHVRNDHLTVVMTAADTGWSMYEVVCLCGWTKRDAWEHVPEDDAYEIAKDEAITHLGNEIAAMIEKLEREEREG